MALKKHSGNWGQRATTHRGKMDNKLKLIKIHIEEQLKNKNDLIKLNQGLNHKEITKLENKYNLVLPQQLRDFYEFSYGAQLDEYQILTIPEIIETKQSLVEIYQKEWKETILPFGYLLGVGDIIAIDTSIKNEEGYSVLDGFHELPPKEWKVVCNGILKWIQLLINNDCQSFWL